jgi:hypothetical protein
MSTMFIISAGQRRTLCGESPLSTCKGGCYKQYVDGFGWICIRCGG